MRAKEVTENDRRTIKSIGRLVGSPDLAGKLFEMANLFPVTTGLPMTVWVSPRGKVRHDVRMKVNRTRGNQMDASNTAVVGVRPFRVSSPGALLRRMSRRYSIGYR